MTERLFVSSSSTPAMITAGTPVIDVTGRVVGAVRYVKAAAPEAATGAPDVDQDLDAAFARALTEREPGIDTEMAEELVHEGFLKVAGNGLMDNDRYILAGQIAIVDDDHVRLAVSADELAVERKTWTWR